MPKPPTCRKMWNFFSHIYHCLADSEPKGQALTIKILTSLISLTHENFCNTTKFSNTSATV